MTKTKKEIAIEQEIKAKKSKLKAFLHKIRSMIAKLGVEIDNFFRSPVGYYLKQIIITAGALSAFLASATLVTTISEAFDRRREERARRERLEREERARRERLEREERAAQERFEAWRRRPNNPNPPSTGNAPRATERPPRVGDRPETERFASLDYDNMPLGLKRYIRRLVCYEE